MADDPQLDNLSAEETADAVVAAGRSAAGDVEAPTVFSDLNTMAVVAVTLAGIGCFFNLYATQPVLPLFEILFHASKAAVGRTVSAATLGVAISAPFCGMLAERIGRRRVIVWSIFLLAVPTIGAATANGLHQLVVWRFFQGLVMPGIFGVTIAYITEEWPRRQVAHVMSIYVSGTVLGGFLGRFLTGVAATHALVPFVAPSWRLGFVLIGLLDLIFGLVLWRWLPLDTPLPPSPATGAFGFLRHLRNPQPVSYTHLVQKQRAGMSEERLGQQHANLFSALELSHFEFVFGFRQVEAIQQHGGVALRAVAVLLAHNAFQFAQPHAVCVGHFRLGIDAVTLFQRGP